MATLLVIERSCPIHQKCLHVQCFKKDLVLLNTEGSNKANDGVLPDIRAKEGKERRAKNRPRANFLDLI